MTAAATFRALGDPVRLEMVLRLSRGSSFTLSRISEGLGITRQGARKHLEVLKQAEIITLTPTGRDVVVELDPTSLATMRTFITKLEKQWDARLDKLKYFVEEEVEGDL